MTATSSDRPSRERDAHSERRMSDVEAAMWNVEKDPYLASTYGSATVLDGPIDLDHFRLRLLRMVDRIPRLHQRVVPGLGRFAPPEWHDDPDFEIDYHLRHISLPAPGSLAQLHELATRIVQDPFDRTRPLWAYTVIDGLEGGRSALVQKMHHTISDGVGSVRMSEQFVDLGRELPVVEEIEIRPSPPAPDSNVLETATDTLAAVGQRTIGAVRGAASGAVDVLRHPDRVAGIPHDVVANTRAGLRQLIVTDPARSPLWTTRSLHRWFDGIDLDFDESHRAAKALGGSLNDFFVAGTVGGAGAYHRQLGAPVAELRMAMPISTRADADKAAGGNSFVPSRVLVPADLDDPVERFEAVHALLGAAKADRGISMAAGMAGVANLLPTSVLARLARQQTETIDFTASNVRAAPFPLYIGGALIESTYPIGPMAGTAFNLTMLSYAGRLFLGLHVDRGAVADPARLRNCLVDAFAELTAAG